MEFRVFDLRGKELFYPCEHETGFYFFEANGIRHIEPNGKATGITGNYIIDWQTPVFIKSEKVFWNDVVYYDGYHYLINPNWYRIDAFDVLGYNFPSDHYDGFKLPTGSRVLNSKSLVLKGNVHLNPELRELL